MKSLLKEVNFSKPLKEQKKPDFVCEPGDPRVKKFGWTKSKFQGYLSFVPEENTIYISSIWSKQIGKGNFSHLIRNIRNAGFIVKVPCPFPRMEAICIHMGFQNIPELWEELGEMVPCYILGEP